MCFCVTLLSAWVTIILLLIICLTCCSARGLSDPSPCAGVAGGSLSISSWLGASPVIELAKLLCTGLPWIGGCSTSYHLPLLAGGIVLAIGSCVLSAHLSRVGMLLTCST